MSIVSNNIKYLRRINGLTQEQFSRRIGIKRSLVGAYEEARANPPLDNLKLIANTFGISVDALIKQDIRKLRDTPDFTFSFDAKATPEPNPNPEPQAIGQIMERFIPREQQTTHVAQSVAFKPVYPDNTTHYATPTPQAINEPKRFNTQYEAPQQGEQRHFQHSVSLIKRHQFVEYMRNFQNLAYINGLMSFQLPLLPMGEYRAFEAGEDFEIPGAFLVCSFVKNWFEIQDNKNYVLVTQHQGIIYRRVYNQVKTKGNLLLSIDNQQLPSHEMPIGDVLEAWEVNAFISLSLPESKVSYEKINGLIGEMKFELERLKK